METTSESLFFLSKLRAVLSLFSHCWKTQSVFVGFYAFIRVHLPSLDSCVLNSCSVPACWTDWTCQLLTQNQICLPASEKVWVLREPPVRHDTCFCVLDIKSNGDSCFWWILLLRFWQPQTKSSKYLYITCTGIFLCWLKTSLKGFKKNK